MCARVAQLACLACALALAGCDGDDGADAGAGEPGAGAVATVGDRQIAQRELAKRAAALRRAQPKGAEPTGEQLERQALSLLLREAALEQEAAERGLAVDAAEVRRRWRAAVASQFPTRRALKRFLGRQTEADVLHQLRLQALTEKIHDHVRRAAGDGRDAVEAFEREFQERWRERTKCRERYVVAGCGNAPDDTDPSSG